ncbi:unnamed protein product [Parnassius mnemosyne]|uniref:Fatty acyl-CoA reductase n=1 Tax=Parnassius mnemosyne TaxID=213953 RepID=A0AAV1LH69_9NEOP
MEVMFALEKEALIRQYRMAAITASGNSSIERFYAGSTVFVTGGSGFVGKLLVEKLFRSCNVNKVFLLLRSKKDKNAQQRANDILMDPVFDSLHKHKPDFVNNVFAMEGNVSKVRLGLNNSDWNTLAEQVNIIFHVAATVNFDETIKKATLTNVRGTRETLHLARACKNLRSIVHVSTAYSHATKSRIDSAVKEQFYESPMPPNAMIELAENMDEKNLNSIALGLMDDWPNTYSFSKALAEEIVRNEAHNLPICIVRPAIVISSYHDPMIGWIDPNNAYGASGLILGIITGILHTLNAKQEIVMSFVPVDIVVNTIIAAGWETTKQQTNEDDIKIYNVTNNRSPMLLGDLSKVLNTDARNIISPRAIWYCFVIEATHKFVYLICTVLLHFIPAFFVDSACKLLNKRPILSKIYKKVYKLSTVLSYYTTNGWKFQDDNVLKDYNNMSKNDQEVFNCDMATVDFRQLVVIWVFGVRKYIIKDGLLGTEQVIKRQFWLKIITYGILCLYLYIFYNILIMIYRTVVRFSV